MRPSPQNPTPGDFDSKERRPRWVFAVVIAAMAALVYANSLRAPFLFDDAGAILKNTTIRHLWSWAALSPPADGSTTTGRPLVNLSFAFNYAISGKSPWSYHVVNLSLHILAALVLFALVKETLNRVKERVGESRSADYLAFAIALLWAVHPLNTETVVCVAQRTEGLSSLLYLLTLYAFARATREGARSRNWCTISVLSCLAGMAAKEIVVTAPVLVLLYDRTFVAGTFLGALRKRRGYYVALAATWLLLAALLLQGGGARGASAGFGLGVSSWRYLLQQAHAIVLYLKLSVWPHPLVLDYGTAVPTRLAEVWWHGALVLVLLAATAWALVRRPLLGFLGAWFIVILAPSSSVVPLVSQSMAEHRMYLPLIAVVTVVAIALRRWLLLRQGWFIVASVALLLGAMTYSRNEDYRDALTIWRDTVQKYPISARGHNNLALELQARGSSDDANREFAEAIALNPEYVSARYNWGAALLAQQRFGDAIEQLSTATRLSPGLADAHLNLGIAYVRAGSLAQAIAEFETASKLDPGAADVCFNLGVALDLAGQRDAAAVQFKAALERNPSLVDAWYRLARVAEESGDSQTAMNAYDEVLRHDPNHAAAEAAVGVLYARIEKLDMAEMHLRISIRLRPDDPDTLSNLGNVFLLQGKTREAIASYENSLRLRPDDAGTRQNLEVARETLGGAPR